MKRLLIIAAVLVLGACKVEKTGQDTYKVVTPTPEAKAAGQKAKVEAKDLGAKVAAGAAKVAKSAGEELQKVGQKTEEHTGTSSSSTETTGTTTTTKTETRRSVTKHP